MRVWYIYTDNCGNYTVAKQPAANFIVSVAGPLTWDEAVTWMRANGRPGW